VGAVKAAGLLETLRGPGPYTVFAPTDEEFRKIPRATLRRLLEPRNRATLAKILTYHVVPGRLAAADVVALNGAKTVEGGLVKFSSNGQDVHVDNARVLKANVQKLTGSPHASASSAGARVASTLAPAVIRPSERRSWPGPEAWLVQSALVP